MFTTKKGTTLPLLNLKGKQYLQVAHRVQWFREENPLGRIDTECIERTDKYVVYKATISIPIKATDNIDLEHIRIENLYTKLADAYKREDFAHFPDANEKASTGAIGRALALVGYGTQFTHELDEHERIVDSPMPMSFAPFPFEQEDNIGPYRISFGKYQGKHLQEINPNELEDYCSYILKKAEDDKKPIQGKVAEFLDKANIYLNNQEKK